MQNLPASRESPTSDLPGTAFNGQKVTSIIAANVFHDREGLIYALAIGIHPGITSFGRRRGHVLRKVVRLTIRRLPCSSSLSPLSFWASSSSTSQGASWVLPPTTPPRRWSHTEPHDARPPWCFGGVSGLRHPDSPASPFRRTFGRLRANRRAKGSSGGVVMTRHILRNSLSPLPSSAATLVPHGRRHHHVRASSTSTASAVICMPSSRAVNPRPSCR